MRISNTNIHSVCYPSFISTFNHQSYLIGCQENKCKYKEENEMKMRGKYKE